MKDSNDLEGSRFRTVNDYYLGKRVTVQKRTGNGVMSGRLVPIKGCRASRRQVATISCWIRFAASMLPCPMSHQISSRSCVAVGLARTVKPLRLPPLGTAFAQKLKCGFAVHEFATLSLSEACGYRTGQFVPPLHIQS
jgi:hypothetical protein